MRKIISSVLAWLKVQAYITFAVIFLSKEHLVNISQRTGNHPLIIYNSSRWMRIWWFAYLLIVVWGFYAWPMLKLFTAIGTSTWYAEFTHQDQVIFFGKFYMSFAWYYCSVMLSCGLLMLFEVKTCNKMEHFRRFTRRENTIEQKMKQDAVLLSEV